MHVSENTDAVNPEHLALADRWILSRLTSVTRTLAEALDEYRFNDAAGALYHFVWHEFCDLYLEAVKPALYGKEGEERLGATRNVLRHVLKNTLILLHPFVPFVTEEIWHKLPRTSGSIMTAAFPLDTPEDPLPGEDNKAESRMELISGMITGIRNIRGEMGIAPSLALDVTLQSSDNYIRGAAADNQDLLINLARLKSFTAEKPGPRPKAAATAIVANATLFVSLEGIIDFAKEAGRLEKEMQKIDIELGKLSKKLNNDDFLNKAPDQVVAKVREKSDSLAEKQDKLKINLDRIREFEGEK